MLFSPSSVSADTVLDNANTLAHEWNPLDPFKQRLKIMDAGVIKVVPKDNSVSIMKPSALSETLAQEKMILLWHFAQFKQVVTVRAQKINQGSITDLQTCYQISHTLQGMIQLCHVMKKQFSHYMTQIDSYERNQTIPLDMLGKLAQVQLKSDFIKILDEADGLIHALRAKQKTLLTQIALLMIMIEDNTSFGYKILPKSFKLDVNQSHHPELSICAKWTISDVWTDFTQQPIAPMVNMHLFMGEIMIPINCFAYPCFQPDTGYQPITQAQVESGMYGTLDYCQQFLNSQGEGSVSYQPRDLLMMLSGPIQLFNAEFLLLYTQLMVEIATLGDYRRVVFYAPYSFSYKACELGFHSDDTEFPSLEAQKNFVAEKVNQRAAITIDESLDRYSLMTQEELLRPYYFNVRENQQREIFDSTEGITMTYAELMKDKKILVSETYPNGIFPECQQVPKHPFRFSMRDLMNREVTGKLPNARVSHKQEKVDFHWLQDDRALQQIGTGTHDEPGKHKTLLRVKPV